MRPLTASNTMSKHCRQSAYSQKRSKIIISAFAQHIFLLLIFTTIRRNDCKALALDSLIAGTTTTIQRNENTMHNNRRQSRHLYSWPKSGTTSSKVSVNDTNANNSSGGSATEAATEELVVSKSTSIKPSDTTSTNTDSNHDVSTAKGSNTTISTETSPAIEQSTSQATSSSSQSSTPVDSSDTDKASQITDVDVANLEYESAERGSPSPPDTTTPETKVLSSNSTSHSSQSTSSKYQSSSSPNTDLTTSSSSSKTALTPPSTAIVESPLLPWGDWNVLIVTDVHAWIGGHNTEHEPNIDIDYGDVLSFHKALNKRAEELSSSDNEKDLFFVMNGDWSDGSGLAMNGDLSYIEPLLERMPWDVLTLGNHELYLDKVVDYLQRPAGWVQAWGEHHVTSNVISTKTGNHLGKPFRLLQGKSSRVLALSFLYEMPDASPHVKVQTIQEVMREDWIKIATDTPDLDGILVLAHMHVTDPLVYEILQGLRQMVGADMPIVFATGHTHIRDYARLDPNSISLESGHYLDTLGFISVTGPSKASGDSNRTSAIIEHVLINANREAFNNALGSSAWETEEGLDYSKFIQETRESLGLNEGIACLPQTYYVNRSLYDTDGLWNLFQREVVPTMLDTPRLLMLSRDSWRYELFKGLNTLDDIIRMSPYNDTLVQFHGVPATMAQKFEESLNANSTDLFLPLLPNYIFSSAGLSSEYTLVVESFQLSSLEAQLREIYPNLTKPKPFDDFTTTTIWIEYLKKYADQPSHSRCPQNGFHLPNPFNFGTGSSSSKKKSSTTNGNNGLYNSYESSSSAEDDFQLFFVVIAISVVAVLAVIQVRQRSITYRREMHAKDGIIMQALREYHGEEAYHDNFDNHHREDEIHYNSEDYDGDDEFAFTQSDASELNETEGHFV